MNQTGQTTLHRALFLDELVKLMPKEIAHFGKRVDQIIDNGENGITLHFKDNTTVAAGAVIGAAGVHSPTRVFSWAQITRQRSPSSRIQLRIEV